MSLNPQLWCTCDHIKLTLNPPVTSTRTAKLVRCVLEHWTVVRFPTVLISSVVTPEVAQLPFPILYNYMHELYMADHAQAKM